MIDLEFIQGLIRAVDESGVDSIEIERGGTRVRVAKTPNGTAAVAPAPAVNQPPPAPRAAAAPGAPTEAPPGDQAGADAAAAGETPGEADDGLVQIESPMVGTFYRASNPDADPFVEVGSSIGEGDVLCIIEAMKLMNELEAEVSGTIAEVLVENAEPVEFGQPLFKVKPA